MKSSLSRIAVASLLVAGVINMVGIAFQDREVNAAGNTYYVATNGSDSNSGSQSSPFRTIRKGLSVMSAGNTLSIRGGTYNEYIDGNVHKIPAGTSWNNPAIVKAFPGEAVTIRPGSGNEINIKSNTPATPYLVQYLIIDGIHFDTFKRIQLNNAEHVRFQNVEISNGTDACVYVWPGKFNEFLNSRIHDCRSHGFYVSDDNNLFDGLQIYDNGNIGMQLFVQGGGTGVDNNIVRNSIFRNNGVIASNGYQGLWMGSGTNNLAYNNIVYGNRGAGIVVGSNNPTNTKVFNNTVYGNGEAGIHINEGSGAVIRNNIVYQNTGTIVNNGSNTQQSNNLTSDPRFVSSSDFHLQAGSPAIDAGTSLPEVPCDFDGNRRPGGAAYDIGAYEYGSSKATDCPRGTTGGGATPVPATPTPVPPPVITLSATPSSLSIVGPTAL